VNPKMELSKKELLALQVIQLSKGIINLDKIPKEDRNYAICKIAVQVKFNAHINIRAVPKNILDYNISYLAVGTSLLTVPYIKNFENFNKKSDTYEDLRKRLKTLAKLEALEKLEESIWKN